MEMKYSDPRIEVLMACLREGEENAVNRTTLSLNLDMNDRAVRELIEKARNEGCFILNKQNGKGYYLPAGIEDIHRQYKQDTNRALAILKRRKFMRQALKEAGIAV